MDVRSLIMSTTLRWQAAIEQAVIEQAAIKQAVIEQAAIEQAAIEQAAIDLLNGISASNAVDQNLYQDQGEFTNTLRSLLDRAGGGGEGGGQHRAHLAKTVRVVAPPHQLLLTVSSREIDTSQKFSGPPLRPPWKILLRRVQVGSCPCCPPTLPIFLLNRPNYITHFPPTNPGH